MRIWRAKNNNNVAFVIDIMVWIVNRISTPVAAGRGRDEGIDQVVRINVAQTLTKYLTCIWYDLLTWLLGPPVSLVLSPWQYS